MGAVAIFKIGINRALWVFGVFQLVTIFGFVWLSQAGSDPWVLAIVIAGEYLGAGLGTSAYVAYIARETSRMAVATQLALFTALASLPRVVSFKFQRFDRRQYWLDGLLLLERIIGGAGHAFAVLGSALESRSKRKLKKARNYRADFVQRTIIFASGDVSVLCRP